MADGQQHRFLQLVEAARHEIESSVSIFSPDFMSSPNVARSNIIWKA
jgi:hypothetical protein